MKRFLLFFVAAAVVVSFQTAVFAQGQAGIEWQPFGGKLKIQGYGEYIDFDDDDIDATAWGGGILLRYLFLKNLGAQTNFSFYGNADTNKLGGDLKFRNWRLSAIVHVPTTIAEQLYIYGGGGVGVQFDDDIGSVKIDNAVTGHVLGGIGWDYPENFHIEAEVGYQFGDAEVSNYSKSEIGLEALFVRAGVGIRF